ncbi:MAG: flagellar basal body L-ring protein FlgH [Verrucomicrobiota bacterium]
MLTKPIIHPIHALAFGLVTAGLFVPDTMAGTGSIWPSSRSVHQSFFADDKASTAGDLITIVVNLSTVATKDQSTETSKESSLNEGITSLLFPPGGDWDWFTYDGNTPVFNWNSARDHGAEGAIDNRETLETTIQARIIEVNPNGTFKIEARRSFETGQENTEMVLSGFIRQSDITATNTVSSSNIAELQILHKGTGTISRQQKKGWLTTLYEFFSPF